MVSAWCTCAHVGAGPAYVMYLHDGRPAVAVIVINARLGGSRPGAKPGHV